jgi:hypothetical protein
VGIAALVGLAVAREIGLRIVEISLRDPARPARAGIRRQGRDYFSGFFIGA